MYYRTEKYITIPDDLSWDDVVFSDVDPTTKVKTYTITRKFNLPLDRSFSEAELATCTSLEIDIAKFLKKYETLLAKENYADEYTSFEIPKRSGGMRTICAPKPEIREAQTELLHILESCGAYHHTSAYAYSIGRNTVSDRNVHKDSNYFFYSDFSDFFGSSSESFCRKMLSIQYPFCMISDPFLDTLFKSLKICFLNGGLPQGTTISPWLTNQIMAPIDYEISKAFKRRKMKYTRYADDICVSAIENFPKSLPADIIRKILDDFDAPYKIKPEKTRSSSIYGKNWHLGLMLNQNHDITVGHNNKRYLKAMLNNFILDTIHNKPWSYHEKQVLHGRVAYYMMVEKEYILKVISRFDQKYNVNTMNLLTA